MNWKKIIRSLPIINKEPPEAIEPVRKEQPKSRWFYKEKYYTDVDEIERRQRDVDYKHWRL